jgi:hypothetical protein
MALYSESVSRFVFRALDHLVGERASPTEAVFSVMHVYEVCPRKDHRGVDLISDALPFGRLWYGKPDHAIGYPKHSSRSYECRVLHLRRSGQK